MPALFSRSQERIKEHPRRWLALLATAILCIIWLGAWYAIDRNRSELLVSAESSARYQAHIYAENTLSTIKRLDTMLRDLRAHWDGKPAKFATAVRERAAYMDDVAFQVGVIDAQGYLAFSNLAAPDKPVFLGERAHFRIHQDNPATDRLFISAPVKGKVSGKWSLQFTRPILQQGRFDGVLVISVSPDIFTTFNEKLGLGDGAVSTMVADSGDWLARQPDNEQAMGRKITEAPYLLPGAPLSGSFTRVAQADGIERIYGFHRLPDYGLNFVVGHAVTNVLAPYRSYRDSVFAAAALVSLLAIMLIVLLGRIAAARSAAQSDLRVSEQRLALAAEAAGIGIWDYDTQNNRLVWDARMYRIFGISPTTFGSNYEAWQACVHPEDLTAASAAVVSALEHGDKFVSEFRVVHPDGRIRNIFANARVLRDAAGQATRMIGLNIDITDRKNEEAARVASEAKYRALFEMLPIGVSLTNEEGQIIESNRAAEVILGLPQAEHNQRHIESDQWKIIRADGSPMPPEDFASVRALKKREAVAGVIMGFERANHQVRWLDVSAAPVNQPGFGVTIVYADITERKRNEAALQQAKEAAEAANVAKSRFLATMSHEIRTPMNGILGMAQLLLMPNLSDQERQEYARIVLNSGQSLLALLNDILDLSKIEAGRIELKASAFEPEHLLAENATLFAEQAAARGVRFEFAWHGPSDRRYQADTLRLRQMIANLLSNALKFTEQGSIVLAGKEVGAEAGQALMEFSVTDTGCGIPPDKLPRLFHSFSQVDDSPTRAYGGTGLGLSIVARLARLMGGEVGVDSTPGQGSRFWFRIRADALAAGSETRQQERHRAIDPPRNIRVLLVEDNPTNRMVVEAMLTKNGIGVDSVENGEQAVAAITNGARPDLVLMDCQMPVMDGHAATRHIRALERDKGWPRLPIVALTAGTFAEEKEACLASGMDDFLAKPVDIRDLLAMIDQRINRKTP